MSDSVDSELQIADAADAGDLHTFGYRQTLRRTLGPYGSFALAFSMISITTAIFFLLPSLFNTTGGRGIWLWFPCSIGVFLIVLVYAHLAARIPLTGFAYQWNSRLVNPHYGWFTGWSFIMATCAGTASIGTALAAIFAPMVWKEPTPGNLIWFAVVMIAIAAVINVISIRLVSRINNAAVGFEFIGSVLAAAALFVGSLFFFHDRAGFAILTQGPADGSSATWYAFALAALLPVTTFLGWEGAADLAEETTDPRSITPTAMIRANYVSVFASFFVIVGFMVAIPHGVKDLLGRTQNALFFTFQDHFGSAAGHVLEGIVFISIFSCLMANMVVGSRMIFSISRDKMLPGSSFLGSVNKHTRTPIYAIVFIMLVAMGIQFLSSGIASNVVSITAVALYAVYFLTVAAAVYAIFGDKLPEVRDGDFSLGAWAKPVAVAATLWSIVVIVDIGAPRGGHIAVEYLLGGEVLGLLWYLLYLRSRIKRRTVGVEREEVVSLERAASDLGGQPAAQSVGPAGLGA